MNSVMDLWKLCVTGSYGWVGKKMLGENPGPLEG